MNSQQFRAIKSYLRFSEPLRRPLMETMNRFILCSILSLTFCSAAIAAGEATKERSNNIFKSDHAQNDPDNPAPQEVSLDDLQDVALLLRFIKGQCINIYQEAARTSTKPSAGPEPRTFRSIPESGLSGDLLAPRQEWLVFYMGTMEPVIRQMAKQVTDIRAGSKQVVIPPSLEATLRPLWERWASNTQELNHHLDELVPLFDDNPPDNSKIQNEAVLLYNDVQHMEQNRRDIFLEIRAKFRSGNHEKVLISPP